MGQGYRHENEGSTEAGRLAYEAIRQLKAEGVSDSQIILGFMAELHSLSSSQVHHEDKHKIK